MAETGYPTRDEWTETVLRELFGSLYRAPSPCRTPPKFWDRRGRRCDKQVLQAFRLIGAPGLTQDVRDRYWAEVRKGQDIYEDAGGYIIRCWSVMLGDRNPPGVTNYRYYGAKSPNMMY